MNLVVGVGIEPTFRVFQTRANPSQLSDLGTPGRIRTRNFDVRSVALFQLSYRSSDEELERAVRLELTNTGFAIRRLSRLATRAVLERKERFELSSRVWKTRMFPATSLPHE